MPKPNSSTSIPTIERNDLRLEWLDPTTLQPNPLNWKTHPAQQVHALGAGFDEIGWAGALLFNERTRHLLDGHARQKEAIERGELAVPTLVIDVDEAQERKILRYLDLVGGLWNADASAVARLNALVETENATLYSLMWGEDLPVTEAEAEETAAEKEGSFPKGGISLVLGQQWNYVVLVFRTEIDWVAAQDHFAITEKMDPFTNDVGIGRVLDGGQYLDRVLTGLAAGNRALAEDAQEATLAATQAAAALQEE